MKVPRLKYLALITAERPIHLHATASDVDVQKNWKNGWHTLLCRINWGNRGHDGYVVFAWAKCNYRSTPSSSGDGNARRPRDELRSISRGRPFRDRPVTLDPRTHGGREGGWDDIVVVAVLPSRDDGPSFVINGPLAVVRDPKKQIRSHTSKIHGLIC